MDIEALLFHALLLVPQQDRRDEWSQGTTKLLRSPESGMDGEAQPHSGVLSCITCRNQGFSFPQTHLEHNTGALQTRPSLALPALLLTLVHSPRCWKGMECSSAARASILWLSSPPPASAVSRQGAHLEPCPGWISATHMLRCGFGKHLALGSRPSE